MESLEDESIMHFIWYCYYTSLKVSQIEAGTCGYSRAFMYGTMITENLD